MALSVVRSVSQGGGRSTSAGEQHVLLFKPPGRRLTPFADLIEIVKAVTGHQIDHLTEGLASSVRPLERQLQHDHINLRRENIDRTLERKMLANCTSSFSTMRPRELVSRATWSTVLISTSTSSGGLGDISHGDDGAVVEVVRDLQRQRARLVRVAQVSTSKPSLSSCSD